MTFMARLICQLPCQANLQKCSIFDFCFLVLSLNINGLWEKYPIRGYNHGDKMLALSQIRMGEDTILTPVYPWWMLPLTFSNVNTFKESKERQVRLKSSELVLFISLWRKPGRILFIQSKKNGQECSEGISVVILYPN